MLLWIVAIVVAWTVLSVPVAVVVGRMLAAGHGGEVRRDQARAGGSGRVIHLARVEARRRAAARWSHQARVLTASRRGVAETPVGVGR